MVEKTRAFDSSGRMSSSVSSWYISLFRALFSACGSMQILRSPFFLRATPTLLIQSVGSSTCAITFIVCSLLSSLFSGSRRATGTRRVAATTWSNAAVNFEVRNTGQRTQFITKNITETVQHRTEVLATVATCFRLFVFMVMMFMRWLALLPRKGARTLSSLTTMNFTLYRLLLPGFCSSTL